MFYIKHLLHGVDHSFVGTEWSEAIKNAENILYPAKESQNWDEG